MRPNVTQNGAETLPASPDEAEGARVRIRLRPGRILRAVYASE